jgi:hypothetical protein
MRSAWLILALASTAAMFYFMWIAWRDVAVSGGGERLMRIGLMIGFAIAGAECFKRATRRR